MGKEFLIYMHTSPNGKSYIGQTCNLAKRNSGHQQKTGCRALYAAIQKYGWENFEHKTLAAGLTLEQANEMEAALISEHNTMSPNGYNLRTGGANSFHSDETKKRQREVKLGTKHTPEAIAKISRASKMQSAESRAKAVAKRTGLKRSEESKLRMSAAMTGLKRSAEGCANIRAAKQNMPMETRAKISASRMGIKMHEETRKKLLAANTGRRQTDESRAKISAALKGKIVSQETRQRQSDSTKGRVAHNKGIPMSDAQKKKVSLAKSNPSQETRLRISIASKAAWEKRKQKERAALGGSILSEAKDQTLTEPLNGRM